MNKENLREIFASIIVGLICIVLGIMIGVTIVSIKKVTVSDNTRSYLISCDKQIG